MRSTGLTKKKFNQIGLKIMKGTYNSFKKICISKWSVGRFWRYHLACTAHSANFGGFFCLCTTGPSKAPNRSFWNRYFFEAYICTFHNLKSNLVELFFCQTHASDYMWLASYWREYSTTYMKAKVRLRLNIREAERAREIPLYWIGSRNHVPHPS